MWSKSQRDNALSPETASGVIGLAADHAGYDLHEHLMESLKQDGFRVQDFGPSHYRADDDYPDFVVPLARAVSDGRVWRGVAVCGSGVGACIAANKVPGVRAAVVQDLFTARQGVEDDDMNVLCLGARVIGFTRALDLVRAFLRARFAGEERFLRRLRKIEDLETSLLDVGAAI